MPDFRDPSTTYDTGPSFTTVLEGHEGHRVQQGGYRVDLQKWTKNLGHENLTWPWNNMGVSKNRGTPKMDGL